ncbi:thioredoxin domain-containing protein 17 [Meleagris gallopavo]|uniref:thioredoxin domain-containing protein 17 n=1 Tax=Meleagris gallopavo TaxID=9103 RepID=UPI0012AB929A|nr:thioredoxin domain-containing protein 17 [Meleagris gallopavo]
MPHAELSGSYLLDYAAACRCSARSPPDSRPHHGVLTLRNYSLAEPVVRKELHNMPDESVFIYCLVGDRAYWKDPNNEFRKNLKLTGVPTLLKYGTPQKLVEEECFKADLVRMLFTED